MELGVSGYKASIKMSFLHQAKFQDICINYMMLANLPVDVEVLGLRVRGHGWEEKEERQGEK